MARFTVIQPDHPWALPPQRRPPGDGDAKLLGKLEGLRRIHILPQVLYTDVVVGPQQATLQHRPESNKKLRAGRGFIGKTAVVGARDQETGRASASA